MKKYGICFLNDCYSVEVKVVGVLQKSNFNNVFQKN